jgi:hypothetical protein
MRFGRGTARIKNQHDQETLLQVAADPTAKSRRDAINSLWGMSDKLTDRERERLADICRSALHSPDSDVRGEAVLALGELRNPEDLDRIEAALADGEWFTRLSAVVALSWQAPPIRTAAIEQLLDDPDDLVREQVHEVLKDAGVSIDRRERRSTRRMPRSPNAKAGDARWLRSELLHFLHDLPAMLALEVGLSVLIGGLLWLWQFERLGDFMFGIAWVWLAMTPFFWVFRWRTDQWQAFRNGGCALAGIASVWAALVLLVMMAVLRSA